MASQSQPTTPVRVPKSAATYSPTIQDADLRSQINSALLREGHIEKISQTLHHHLHAHKANWPSLISTHALSLLRSGEITTFPKLMERVLADVRADTELALQNPSSETESDPQSQLSTGGTATPDSSNTNGTQRQTQTQTVPHSNGLPNMDPAASIANGNGQSKGELPPAVGVGGRASLALPQAVIDEGVKVTRECLELVAEIEE